MPLDKMPDSEQFIPTHKSTILHTKGKPVACIIDQNPQNKLRYEKMLNHPDLKASLIGFLNKAEDLGLFMGFKLKIQADDDFFEYTVYPNDEFIETVIFDEIIYIIDEKLENLFSLRIITDQFVKTKSEFDKFQKMIT
ncbi:MAG: hypothetical protein OEM77_00405 [Nitrosopumilus sp.]|nr:hypothetical protein [Nitrosopumilus sp.]MDH3736373.1 hypothetical protein [Nitrosopumilus sp.]MDH3822310.1 hypothetical protein [Nitrosopumilus sp.]MDH3834853.1 hypothetical protein [Nitrosopumilus sp.]